MVIDVSLLRWNFEQTECDKRGGGEATSQSNNVDSYKKFFQVFNGYSIVTDKF